MSLSQDVRAGVRGLRQSPGFSAIAILTLALGIGANASIFSVINAILFRPLPYVERGDELVSFNETLGANTGPFLSYPDYKDFRDRNSVLSGAAVYRPIPASVGLRGSTQRMWGQMVSGNYFQLLGVKPLAGRLLQPEDDLVRGGHPVMILTYTGWQKRFGGDPNIVGAKVEVNGREFTVLGITPRGFIGTEIFISPEAMFPVAMEKELDGGPGSLDLRSATNFFVVGRRKPGITQAQAQSALNVIAGQLSKQFPQDDGGMKITLTPPGLGGSYMRDPTMAFTAVMFGVSVLVLLVACANLASMLLARAGDKRKETAIRLALGAGRGVLIRQLLTENLIVALLGGLGGALLSVWIMGALAAWHPPIDIPLIVSAPVDLRVFLFALLLATFTTLLFGLLPAFQATNTDLIPALKNEAPTTRFRYWHLRDYMVLAQVCLSVLLLFCSVLVVKSLQRSLDAPLGFKAANLATVSFDLNMQGYSEARGLEFQRRMLDKVRQLPGIESAAFIDSIPLTVTAGINSVYLEGKSVSKNAADVPIAAAFMASSDYFQTMQTRLLSGREFNSSDKPDSPRVAIVNSTFVAKLLNGANPLGRRFSTTLTEKPYEIVGVVEAGKYVTLNEATRPAYWLPMGITYSSGASLVARTRLTPPDSAVPAIRAAVRSLDPTVSLFNTGSVQEQMTWAFFPARIAAAALSAFGVLALILSATGIYGIMAYAVSRRTREIGIRMAIGATQGQVLASVASRAATLIGTGLLLGLGLALVAGRFLETILFGVKPSDPLSFAIVFALMILIGAAATFLPARRATRIDPLKALRQE